MGHLVGKDVYRNLGKGIDKLHVRTPWNEELYAVLKELYTTEEAELIVKMPMVFSGIDRISRISKIPLAKLQKILNRLSNKGLVMDFFVGGEQKYMASPFIVGIFEFAMMRTVGQPDTKKHAKLLSAYLKEGSFFHANFPAESQISFARALPHQEALADHVEILDYESVEQMVEANDKFALGLCSCRHKREHAEGVSCDKGTKLETCTSFGNAADYIIRNKMGREISKSEVLDICAESKASGLVFSADNVQQKSMFLCHCCGCCCSIFQGINEQGLSNALMTSSCVIELDVTSCVGCGKCETECPTKAIKMEAVTPSATEKRKKLPQIDHSFCIGCGVCALKCAPGSLQLVKREKRVIHPATTFERVMLQCLERGTLQNQIFDNPESMTQEMMRGFIGGFLRLPPVKKALMSDLLRSTFLKAMGAGVRAIGKGYVHEL